MMMMPLCAAMSILTAPPCLPWTALYGSSTSPRQQRAVDQVGVLRELFSASGAAVNDADFRRTFFFCMAVRLFYALFHPVAESAAGLGIAQLTAHPLYLLSSQITCEVRAAAAAAFITFESSVISFYCSNIYTEGNTRCNIIQSKVW
jgi:hypothetical protein